MLFRSEKLTSDTPSFVLEVTWPRVALFYHPASPLCMQVRDRYVSVAREIRRRSIRAPVEFWAVSCEIHREACEDLGISAVPRLLGFPQGSIEGKLIQRTKNNDIEVEEIIHLLSVNLKAVDEAEEILKQRQKDEEDKSKMKEYQRSNRNDPQRKHIGKADPMREILHPHSVLSDIYRDDMESFLSFIHSNIQMDQKNNILPWTVDRLQIFREWIDLMHWALLTRDMVLLHNVINDMLNNFQTIEGSPKELKEILKSHDYYKHKRKWSTSCVSANPKRSRIWMRILENPSYRLGGRLCLQAQVNTLVGGCVQVARAAPFHGLFELNQRSERPGNGPVDGKPGGQYQHQVG